MPGSCWNVCIQTARFYHERALARLVGVRKRKPPGRGFDPRLAQRKKTPSLVPCPKHSWGPAFLTGNGPLCMGGAGVRGFSRLA